jgi:hypothetical protein
VFDDDSKVVASSLDDVVDDDDNINLDHRDREPANFCSICHCRSNRARALVNTSPPPDGSISFCRLVVDFVVDFVVVVLPEGTVLNLLLIII